MAETPAHIATHPLPTSDRLIVTIGVMAAVLLQVLDTTIANVALPHMQASLSATQDTINWVLTSYIVASAIALPISGWLADKVGRKRLLRPERPPAALWPWPRSQPGAGRGALVIR